MTRSVVTHGVCLLAGVVLTLAAVLWLQRGMEHATAEGERSRTPYPATGQTKCYDDAGREIPCDNADFPGQDGFYRTGFPGEARFVDNKDGTVTDTCTGLMWQKDMADTDRDGKGTRRDSVAWREALNYCEKLSFAGHDDWRLPNVRELHTLVDYGRFNPSIDPVFAALALEPGSPPSIFWSSTAFVASGIPWYADFTGGSINLAEEDPCYVRAVRNAQ